MNDDQLDGAIATARERYRVAPPPDLEAMWQRIEARRSPRRARLLRLVPTWRIAAAAAIVLSFALGRWTVRTSGSLPDEATTIAAQSRDVPAPVTSVTSELLGQTVELLSAIPANGDDPSSDRRFARQAGDLLATTRLLLDSRGVESDPSLRLLLEDLELVLAQVARLHAGETRTERELITEALAQQDLVPRIRIIAAGLNVGAD